MTSERCNTYINDISCRSDSPVLVNNEKSEIAEFFAYTNVLITGGTGFLGKLIIEKLLRSCPDISTIYMIVRPKKGKSSKERFKENFEDVIYDVLRREQPNFTDKVVMIEGDVNQEGYGISPENKALLMNTNIIFHAAATVRFDEEIRLAMNVNVKSIKHLLLFAKQLPNLKAYVHVSTAFSNCTQKCIEEKHYEPPIDGDTLSAFLDKLDNEKIKKIYPILLGDFPNTYIFTKAIGESMLIKYGSDLPACIVRPSVVISTYEDPITAWTNNWYGATGVTLGVMMGILRTMYCIPEITAEVIPADYVVSNTIAAAWDVQKRRSEKLNESACIPDEERIPVYNCVSSCDNKISWGTFMYKNKIYGLYVPSVKIYWYYIFLLNRYEFMQNLCVFFLHTLPAVIVDAIAYLLGKKPQMLAVYRKVTKFATVINFFSSHEWEFRNNNVRKLWEKCNSRDQELFKFNMKTFDWEAYFFYHIRGIRMYLLNDPLDTVEEALIKNRKLCYLHYTLVTILLLLGLWTTVSSVSFLWSLCPLAD